MNIDNIYIIYIYIYLNNKTPKEYLLEEYKRLNKEIILNKNININIKE